MTNSQKHSQLDTQRFATQQWIAVGALVGVNAVWGLSFPIMKSLNLFMEQSFGLENDAVPSSLSLAFCSGMIGIRFFLSFLVLSVAWPSLVRHASGPEWRAGICVGVFFYVGLVLQVLGLATIPASRSGFLTSLTAVFTPVFSALFFRKAISWNVLAGVAIALFGVAILTGLLCIDTSGMQIASDALSKWTLGDTLTTLGAVLFTGQVLLLDHYGSKIHSTAITPGMFLTVSIAAAVTFGYLHASSLASLPTLSHQPGSAWTRLFFSPTFIGNAVFLAIFCSVLAFVGMNKYQPHVSAVQASIIYSTEPVFASAWALFLPGLLGALDPRIGYPNEVLSSTLLLGGAIVLLANIVALWPKNTRDQTARSENKAGPAPHDSHDPLDPLDPHDRAEG